MRDLINWPAYENTILLIKSSEIERELPMMTEEAILRTVVGISFLILMAKILAAILRRFKLPEVVGEVLAGVIFGPYALGGLLTMFGEPLIQLNEITEAFSLIGGIVLLFTAGLEFTFADFVGAGPQSFTVGSLGVLVPLLMVLGTYSLLHRPLESGLLVGAALAATSIAITVRTLEEMRQLHSEEAKIIINAAVIDDVLSLATLTVVASIIEGGKITIQGIAFTTLKALMLWLILLLTAVYILPKFIDLQVLWRQRGLVEAASVAVCFGLAFLAAMMGLSPIVGAFAAGMAMAGSTAIPRVREHAEKWNHVFGPLFFAVTGSYLNPLAVLEIDYLLFVLLFVVAILSKVLGCGLPAAIFMKNPDRGLRVGLGMMSRGEIGFIVAGLALSRGYIQSDTYAALMTLCMLTSILTPYLLSKSFTTPILTKREFMKKLQREDTINTHE